MGFYTTQRRNKNRGYTGLLVWQRAIDLFELVWKIAYIDSTMDFKLRAQLADAAQSVAANIAEGYGRRSVKEYIRFLYVALGSMAETMARSVGLARTAQIDQSQFEEIDALHCEVEHRLLRLIEKLEQKRDDGDWTARIAEDPEEYVGDPLLHHSTTPPLHPVDA